MHKQTRSLACVVYSFICLQSLTLQSNTGTSLPLRGKADSDRPYDRRRAKSTTINSKFFELLWDGQKRSETLCEYERIGSRVAETIKRYAVGWRGVNTHNRKAGTAPKHNKASLSSHSRTPIIAVKHSAPRVAESTTCKTGK